VSGPYAAFLALEGSRCVVVGGGEVAERKTRTLLASGAAVVVVAPRVIEALAGLAAEGAVTLKGRRYRPDDLDGARLAFAATHDPAVNAGVVADARARGVLVNSADQPESGDFIVPATMRRGDITLAISTGGRSPSFARQLREELESWLTDERAELLDVLAAVRCNLQATGQSPGPEAWRQAVDAEVVRAIQSGDPEAARRRLVATLQAALLSERAERS